MRSRKNSQTKSGKGKRDIKPIILLIDSSALIYSAYYTHGNLSYEGLATGIIYGFLRNVLSLAKKFRTNDFIFCWDSKHSLRKEIDPEYKYKRRIIEDPEKIQEAIDRNFQAYKLRKKILPRLGFNNSFVRRGFEADDLIAWWVQRLTNQAIIVSNDNDLFQLLDRCPIFQTRTKTLYTEKHFRKDYRISPSQWSLAKAIGGCDSDSVKGIKGVSDPKKKTSKVLWYLRGEMKQGKLYDKIQSSNYIIEHNMNLVHLPCSLKRLPNMIKQDNEYNRSAFLTLFDKLHFKSMLKQENFVEWERGFFNGNKTTTF